MKKISDYIFCDSWQLNEMYMRPNEEYVVRADIGDLKEGELVRFIGFDDVDNHFGIFVFQNTKGEVLGKR